MNSGFHGTFRAVPQHGYGRGAEIFGEKKGYGIWDKGEGIRDTG
jgi:hypothetical protein